MGLVTRVHFVGDEVGGSCGRGEEDELLRVSLVGDEFADEGLVGEEDLVEISTASVSTRLARTSSLRQERKML